MACRLLLLISLHNKPATSKQRCRIRWSKAADENVNVITCRRQTSLSLKYHVQCTQYSHDVILMLMLTSKYTNVKLMSLCCVFGGCNTYRGLQVHVRTSISTWTTHSNRLAIKIMVTSSAMKTKCRWRDKRSHKKVSCPEHKLGLVHALIGWSILIYVLEF